MKEGWEERRLDEVCRFDPPKSEAKAALDEDDFVSFVPMADLAVQQRQTRGGQAKPLRDVYKGYTYFANGDVLLAKITPCFENGKLGIARELQSGVGFGSSEFMVMRPGGKIAPEYLFYFLSQDEFRKAGIPAMTGAVGHKRVPKEWVQSTRIPLPPLAEQQRIVAILDEAFEAIAAATANAEKNLVNGMDLSRTLIAKAFSEIEEGKPTTLAAEVVIQTGFPFKSSDYTTESDAVRLLRGDNIIPGAIRWAAAKRWPLHDCCNYVKFNLEVDDIVVAMDRPWIKAGLKFARIGAQDLPSLLVQRVARLRCGSNLTPGFLERLIGSDLFERHVLEWADGSGVPHISASQIGAFKFVMPSLAEQAQIVQRLQEVVAVREALRDCHNRKLAALAELKQSLLARAFSGALTADHGDEAPHTPSLRAEGEASQGRRTGGGSLRRSAPRDDDCKGAVLEDEPPIPTFPAAAKRSAGTQSPRTDG